MAAIHRACQTMRKRPANIANSYTYRRDPTTSSSASRPVPVCVFWQAGTCSRQPCRFLHPEGASAAAPPHNNITRHHRQKKPTIPPKQHRNRQPNINISQPQLEKPNISQEDARKPQPRQEKPKISQEVARKPQPRQEKPNISQEDARQPQPTLCHNWASGNCTDGDRCKFLHSWSTSCSGASCDFPMVARLNGHQSSLAGVVLPKGLDKLFSADRAGEVRIRDCNTGICTNVFNLGLEVGCLITKGCWIFVGLPNLVKAWCLKTFREFSLDAPSVGQVYALTTSDDKLFAGAQDGTILSWKFDFESEADSFAPARSGKGHTGPVVSLIVGRKFFYSGSVDTTIRMWNCETLECRQVLTGHTDTVMSLLCWDCYLLSCSLDKTVLVWGGNETGSVEVCYTHREDEQVVALFGMMQDKEKPVLYCSRKDSSICLYDLPSFAEIGKIFAKDARALSEGPGGLFFAGDSTGVISVWKWQGKEKNPEAS